MNDAFTPVEEFSKSSSAVPSVPVQDHKSLPRTTQDLPTRLTLWQDERCWRGVREERIRMASEMEGGLLSRLNDAALRLLNATETMHGKEAETSVFLAGLCEKLAGVHRLLHFASAEMRS